VPLNRPYLALVLPMSRVKNKVVIMLIAGF